MRTQSETKADVTWWLAAGLTVLVWTGAFAEETPALTLAAAVAEAQENNPEIRALSADVASANGGLTSAAAWQNPDLTVSPGVRNTKMSGKTTAEFHSTFELKQTIEFPGKRTLRRALAQKNIELRELALAGFRDQLTIQVRRGYHGLLVSRQFLALKEQQLSLAQTFVEAARKRVAGGVASEFDATKAEVGVIAAQKSLREAQAQAASARARLNTVLGRKPDEPLEVADALSTLAAVPDLTNLVQQVLARNPSLKAQEAEVERTGLSLNSVRKSRLPDFNVGPSVEYLKDEQTYDFGITLPLPLWDNKKGEIATATAEQQKALAELDKLRQETLRDVTTAYHELIAAKESLVLFTPEFLAKLQNALDDADQGYAAGRTTLLVYLEAQRTYFETQADRFETLQKLFDTQAALETAVGVPLLEKP